MKLAISGKGGVGKTTLSALLAQVYADMGRNVLAADADPSPCLAGALGFPEELRQQLHPIAEMDDLIEERTGAKPGTRGGFSRSTRGGRHPDRFSVTYRGVKLLEMDRSIWADRAASALNRHAENLVHASAVSQRRRADSGYVRRVEHLGRATVDFVDAMIIVVERRAAVWAQPRRSSSWRRTLA